MVHAFPALPVPMVLLLELAVAVHLAHSVTRRVRWSAISALGARQQSTISRRVVTSVLLVPTAVPISQDSAIAVHRGITVTRRVRWGATRAPRARHHLLMGPQCATQYLRRALLHRRQSRPSLFRPQHLQLWLLLHHQACLPQQLLRPAR